MLTFAKEYENRRVTAEETLQIMKQGYYFIDGIKISLPDNVGFAKVICINQNIFCVRTLMSIWIFYIEGICHEIFSLLEYVNDCIIG